MISISKAELLPLFWNIGPGELGNGLFIMHGFFLIRYFNTERNVDNDFVSTLQKWQSYSISSVVVC